MLATCERRVAAGTSKKSSPFHGRVESPGCTDVLVMASFERRDLIPAQEGLATDDQSRSNLRFLSLRILIYERLERETDDRIKQLLADSRASHHASAEYRGELEFLQAGLAKAVDRLAIEHGIHWQNEVVDVRAPQLCEVSPLANLTVSPPVHAARVPTSSLY